MRALNYILDTKGGGGAVLASGSNGADLVHADNGDDTIVGSRGADLIDGGAGDRHSELLCRPLCKIYGLGRSVNSAVPFSGLVSTSMFNEPPAATSVQALFDVERAVFGAGGDTATVLQFATSLQQINGGSQANAYNGDVVDLSGLAAGAALDPSSPVQFRDFERFVGSQYDDVLTQDQDQDRTDGGVTHGWLQGGAGDDTLYSHAGADVLEGGTGYNIVLSFYLKYNVEWTDVFWVYDFVKPLVSKNAEAVVGAN